MRRFPSIEAFARAAGETLGESRWLTVTQEMIDRFAEATGDYQWIHVDRVRAARSEYGTTIAHGFLTLSLIAQLRDDIYDVDGVVARLNYGCDRVRFLEPVPCGARLRLSLKLARAEPSRRGMRCDHEATMELEGAPRPALVADHIVVLIPA